ncbi:flagellar protein FliT [Clostridium butyricum]|uniref:Flagellar protein FliT n=1 Tax=Clostridium butyricum TaxID=1492 RepID=A0AAP9UGA6_CLOBU|nr:flagellar protein FliT [Clostridium butyricum]MBZ5745180.1 flagellar protein FliT [Clostridium butyricum]MDI9207562.1 flagellar protein FliT [Clostridium butyricum]QMW92129.1 flagellar protein FliT [Clostridium butyricum]BBK75628.1 hypothetical protein Cbu04g_06360 [Clostridium butyricum]GEQ24088.1 hypothetical protein CBU03nite_05110 [Clostridium butyricum]
MENEIFDEYRQINLKIIDSIKNDKEDIKLLEQREIIIKKIFFLNLDKDKIKKIYVEKKIDDLDKELECVLKNKMLSVKQEIKQLTAKKKANLGYATANRTNSFFSTRI